MSGLLAPDRGRCERRLGGHAPFNDAATRAKCLPICSTTSSRADLSADDSLSTCRQILPRATQTMSRVEQVNIQRPFELVFYVFSAYLARKYKGRYNEPRWILFQDEVKFLTGGNRMVGTKCTKPKVRDPAVVCTGLRQAYLRRPTPVRLRDQRLKAG